MAVLADALVVIGQGRLVAAEATDAFVARNSRPEVLVRPADPGLLTDLLARAGFQVVPHPDGSLVVATPDTDAIATIAMRAGIVLRELTVRHSSLEDAFFTATAGAAQFRGRA
jgi:ABC-2 type transport system ATP-binding protein